MFKMTETHQKDWQQFHLLLEVEERKWGCFHITIKKKRKIFLKQVYKFSSPSVLDPMPIPNIHRSKENIGNSHSIFFFSLFVHKVWNTQDVTIITSIKKKSLNRFGFDFSISQKENDLLAKIVKHGKFN